MGIAMSSPSISRSTFHLILTSLITLSVIAWASDTRAECATMFDHSMRKLHSQQTVELCSLVQDKPVLVINTASHCGYTPQFKALEAVHQQYQEQGLVVIGFPSNDFRQEAKDEEKTADICYVNYGVSFTMLAPSHIKGEQANPLFKALAAKSQAPSWNFNKYLISNKGETVQHFGSSVKPDSEQLRAAIELAL